MGAIGGIAHDLYEDQSICTVADDFRQAVVVDIAQANEIGERKEMFFEGLCKCQSAIVLRQYGHAADAMETSVADAIERASHGGHAFTLQTYVVDDQAVFIRLFQTGVMIQHVRKPVVAECRWRETSHFLFSGNAYRKWAEQWWRRLGTHS